MDLFFEYIKKHGVLILFITLELLALTGLILTKNKPRGVILSTTNTIAGNIHNLFHTTRQYFGLYSENDQLVDENTQLRYEVMQLRSRVRKDQEHVSTYLFADEYYEFLPANVISRTVDQQRNYMTLNKGRRDGFKVDRGILCAKGVYGIIKNVSEHYSLVVPLIHVRSQLNVRVAHTSIYGVTKWDGVNYRYISVGDIPKSAHVNKGDTIVTSNFSHYFPDGTPVGVVVKKTVDNDDSFYTLKVLLFADYEQVVDVYGLEEEYRNERLFLESQKQ